MDTPAETPIQDLAEDAIRLLAQGGSIRITVPADDAGRPVSHTYSGDVSRHVGEALRLADLACDAASDVCEAFFTGGNTGLMKLIYKLFATQWAYATFREDGSTQKIFTVESPNGALTIFFESDPPAWLVGGREGSTMDNRWFLRDHVLTLAVDASVQTDFTTITRIA